MSDWFEEQQFWVKKFKRACIRFDAAEEVGDFDKMRIAHNQIELYARRAKAAVPVGVRAEWRKNEEAERKAAFDEEPE